MGAREQRERTDPRETRWSLIESAGEGDLLARTEFARRYEPAVRAYLRARWRGRFAADALEDATQEVFLEFLKPGGVLERARRDGRGEFRALLYAVARNVARREEERLARKRIEAAEESPELELLEAREATHSRLFDREWARALMKEARELNDQRARTGDERGARRAELLRLRFQEGQPIRDIARAWAVEPKRLHREYRRALDEFASCLREVVASQTHGPRDELDERCREFLALLS